MDDLLVIKIQFWIWKLIFFGLLVITGTFAYLTLPILLVIAQTVSLQILTPPSDDPKIQQTQKIFNYLPLLLGYFSLSVPSALGLYWITNNILSTITTGSIKEYFKKNPLSIANIDIEMLATKLTSTYFNAYFLHQKFLSLFSVDQRF